MPGPPLSPESLELRVVADALFTHKPQAARCFFEPLAASSKWAETIESLGIDRFIDLEIDPAVDYLINFLRTDDPTWRDLYLGHQLEFLHWQDDTQQDALARRRSLLDGSRKKLLRLLEPLVDAQYLSSFDLKLAALHNIVCQPAQEDTVVRVLFVGDCLYANLTRFLTVPLLEKGLVFEREFAASKNPVELRNSLRSLAKGKFDLICYSPYSNEFNLELLATYYNPNPIQSALKLRKLAADAHLQTRSTLRLLADLFECAIYVQNTANIRRHNSTLYSYAKNLLTRRPRQIVARELNALLNRTLSEMNRELPRPFIKIDEVALKEQFGELTLGRKYYDSDHHHPSVMEQKLSLLYSDLIVSSKLLATKKVVVIDLDDTVWKGTIGEGAVEHYVERQKTLQSLKSKGVLLAIASKNDVQNVHWTGGVLESRDFIAEQINWDPKPTNIRRIASDINLKLKDFVFIDDRADQRELVKSSIPEIQVLDATAESSWEMLRWWAASLPEQTETDRTQLYQERKQRESFLNLETEVFDQGTMFAALELKVDLHTAARKELPRIAELINRTNQFNTCGSRTSLQQVAGWSESSDYLILVAEARDKFGDMGIVSALVLDLTQTPLLVFAWVLSCRVFGYGIETAMLNHVKRLGHRLGRAIIHGLIVETPHNQPCREVYAAHGFAPQGAIWVAETAAVFEDPAWLEISGSEMMDVLSRV